MELDIQSAKKLFQYLINITPKYNEKPLNYIIDIFEQFKVLQPNELFFNNQYYESSENSMEELHTLWDTKLQLFTSLGPITEDLITNMQKLLDSKSIIGEDIIGFYKQSICRLNTSTVDEFKNNSIDLMNILENYMSGDISESSIYNLRSVYSSYISARSPLNREDKEKIMAKLDVDNLEYHTILDGMYYKLIGDFKKLNHAHTPIFEPEQIDIWEKTYENLTMQIKGTTSGIQKTQKAPINNVNKQTTNFSDIIGLEEAKEIIYDNLVFSNEYPELAEELGNTTANFLLLYGPAGTGKTMLARALVHELDATYREVKGSIEDKYVGESENNLRNIFKKAKQDMKKTGKNSIIYFDEITQTFTSEEQYSRKLADVFKQILTDDELLTHITDEGKKLQTYVIGSTNHIDQLDPNLLRSGRAISVEVPLPNKTDRKLLWGQKLDGKSLSDDINYKQLAEQTDGLSGADIVSIINETPYLKGLRLKNILGDSQIHTSKDALNGIKPDDPRLQITQNLIEEAIRLYISQNFDEHAIPPEMLFI